MTAPTSTLVHDWLLALPDHIRQQVNSTRHIAACLGKAVDRGWTVQQLADEAARDHATSRRIASVVTDRMERAATAPPPRPHTTFATFRQPLAWCRSCSDPVARWALTDADEPARRCACWTDPKGAA